MEIHESFKKINFMLIHSVLGMHVLQMLGFATLPSAVQCIFYSMSCLYIGSTNTLSYYNVKKDEANSNVDGE